MAAVETVAGKADDMVVEMAALEVDNPIAVVHLVVVHTVAVEGPTTLVVAGSRLVAI